MTYAYSHDEHALAMAAERHERTHNRAARIEAKAAVRRVNALDSVSARLRVIAEHNAAYGDWHERLAA